MVGTVDASEFVVALSASVGFLLALSFADVPWSIVGALLVGGLIAAPIAAWIVRPSSRARRWFSTGTP